MPFFSVIIPNYNHAAFLVQRIESVLQQTYKDYELIIIDDASTDDSKSIIDSYRSESRITHIIYNTTNSGSPFGNWKTAIAIAAGEWIWIAESDDYADPTFLVKAAQAISNHSNIGLFYSDAAIVKEDGNPTEVFSRKKNDFFSTQKWDDAYCNNGIAEINDSLKYYCTVNNVSSAVFKKEIALPVLEKFEKFRYHGDWFFYIYLCTVTDVYYCHQPLTYFRRHDNSHLVKNENTLQSKIEKAQILNYLYSLPQVTYKKKLVSFFALYYSGLSFFSDSPNRLLKLIHDYWKINKGLTLKLLWRMLIFRIRKQKPQHLLEF